MKLHLRLISWIIFPLMLISCEDNKSSEVGCNSVYYWRTTFKLDNKERNFLRTNDIKRIYTRFFDVVVDESPIAIDVVVPNATLQITDSFEVDEFIPVIYITVDAIKEIKSEEAKWAEKIVGRIFNMCSYNNLGAPYGIQLDCDWTASTKTTFFNLCREVKKELRNRNSNARLSATIRLHQLSQNPPPVDYGVLMVYNTGSFMNPDESNSILTVENIKPYVKHLADYPMRLEFAYPIFSWYLVYTQNRFRGIIGSDAILPDEILSPLDHNKFKVTKDTIIGNTYLSADDIIRVEEVPFSTIKNVQKLVEAYSKYTHHSNILYCLDSRNISNYTENEFNQIFD